MGDLKSRGAIVLKGVLFAAIILAAGTALVLRNPEWQTVLLVLLLIWASARFYYFLFYVLEKYVDPSLKYAGLWAMVKRMRRG